MSSAAASAELPATPSDAPGVSFVVPIRNGAATIRETIDSIRRQADGRPMEVIVVDDGSEDGSADLVAAMSAACPVRIERLQGRGAAAAVNAGIRVARFPIL